MPGMQRARVNATWSNVLWSSLRTITRQSPPRSLPGPWTRGSSTVWDMDRGYPPSGGLGTLSAPPIQAHVELVRRGRLDQRLAVLAGFGAGLIAQRRREGVRVLTGGELDLAVQLDPHSLELRRGVLDRPEVRQAETQWLPVPDRLQRALPGLDVDVGRRGGGQRELEGRHAHARHVAHERPAGRLMQVADVMRGVPGRVRDRERALDVSLAAAQHAQVGLRHRHDLAPETREALLA